MSKPGTTEILARGSQGKVWLRAGADRQKTALWVQGILLAPSTPMSSLMLPPGLPGDGDCSRWCVLSWRLGGCARHARHRRRGVALRVYCIQTDMLTHQKLEIFLLLYLTASAVQQ